MKTTATIFFIACFVLFGNAQKQDFFWVESTNSGQVDAPSVNAGAMVVDGFGNLYCAGSNGKVGNGVAFGAPCLAKYNSSGSVVWVKYFDGDASDAPHIMFNPDGDLVAMYQGSELDFNGTPTPTSPNTVIVKFDTADNVDWVTNFSGNQYDIDDALVNENGHMVLLISAQFITYDGNTLNGNNNDILMVINGDDGTFELVEHAAYTGAWALSGNRQIFNAGDGEIVALTRRSIFLPPGEFTVLSKIDISDNSIISEDTIPHIYQNTTGNAQYGNTHWVWDFDASTGIAYVSGEAEAIGLPFGTDTIFGVNPNNRSLFIAKANLETGEILDRVVYYSNENAEVVQEFVIHENKIAAFIQYRDTIRNEREGETYTKIDTIPGTNVQVHILIQNFDLDLNLESYNQIANLGIITTCHDAGMDDNGYLYMLIEGGSDMYFDNQLIDASERDAMARMGGETVGISESAIGQKLVIYPNPTNGFVYVEGTSAIDHIQVLDMAGRVCLQQENNGADRANVDVSALKSGVYFLSVTIGETHSIERLVVR